MISDERIEELRSQTTTHSTRPYTVVDELLDAIVELKRLISSRPPTHEVTLREIDWAANHPITCPDPANCKVVDQDLILLLDDMYPGDFPVTFIEHADGMWRTK